MTTAILMKCAYKAYILRRISFYMLRDVILPSIAHGKKVEDGIIFTDKYNDVCIKCYHCASKVYIGLKDKDDGIISDW